jgi:CHASE2 domain-containing sensor protein
MTVAFWIAAIVVVGLLAGMVGALEVADRVAAALSSRYSERRPVRFGAQPVVVVDVTDDAAASSRSVEPCLSC